MKPFDLNAAVAGAPLQTRDGREVTEFHYFKTATEETKIYAVINHCVHAFYDDGRWAEDEDDILDLFLKSEKKKFFVAIKNDSLNECTEIRHTSYAFPAKNDAEDFSNRHTGNWQIVEVEIEC